MEADRARRVHELFYAALEVPAEQRSGFLRSACPDDVVRREVRSLLNADAEPETFLSSPLRSDRIAEPAALPDRMVGRRIGQYTIRRLIGAGGMGVVYEAEQEHPRRTVALKLMRVGIAGPERLRRFQHEADILARLHHPGIAQVFDAGVHQEAGAALPYFAMEYVANARDIVAFARQEGLDPRARLDLLSRVCDAVAHGHQRGVIHRDLKPGNVLVDGTGAPKVIDFGVARLADSDDTAIRTETGQLVGTLRYMSPEQCRGAGGEIDTRTDVYALGVILYELLTGAFPYEVDAASPYELPRLIREVEPRRPSSFDRGLRGDVETLLLKALSKDRERRYASVGDFARDIRRFLNREPIDARRDSGWYVVRRNLRRHWLAASVVAGFVVVCAVSAALLGLLYHQSETQRAMTAEALAVAEQRGYFSSIALAHAALKEGDTRQLLQHLEACPKPLRRWEWFYLRRLADVSLRTFAGGSACAFVNDGTQILSYNNDGDVRFLDAATGRAARTLKCDHGILRCAALSPDEGLLVTGGEDGMIRFWEASTGALLAEARGDATRVRSVAFSPDGERVATGGFDDGVKLWDPRTAAHVGTVAADLGAVGATFSPDGRVLACVTDDGLLILWDLHEHEVMHSLPAHDAAMLLPVFSSDGSRVFTAALDTRIRLWEVRSGALLETIECGTQSPRGVALSPDDRRLAFAAQALRIWNLETGGEEAMRLGHTSPLGSISFAPDGRTLASSERAGVIKVWDASPLEEPARLRGHSDFVRAVGVFPDGRRLASTGRDGTIRIWDVAARREIERLEGHGPGDQELAISRDGRLLVSGGPGGRIRIHDLAGGSAPRTVETGHPWVGGIAISPDGREIASVGAGGACRFWNAADDARIAEIDISSGRLWHVAYSNAGDRFLACDDGGAVHLYDRRALRPIRAFVGNEAAILKAVFSPDDRWIASAEDDGLVRLWDVASGALLHELRGHTRVVQSVAFLPDGSRLISGGYDQLINIWDPHNGTLVMTLRGHKGGVPSLAVAPDGSWFASASNDHTIAIWYGGQADQLPPP